MTGATFDTLKAAEALREAGVEERQAKATVDMVREAVTEGVATKTDIADLKADHGRLEGKIDSLQGKIDSQRWVIGLASAVSAAIILGLMRVVVG